MNDRRRKQLQNAKKYAEQAQEIVMAVMDKEQETLENLPENLQYSEMYEKKEMALDELDIIMDALDDVIDKIDNVASV